MQGEMYQIILLEMKRRTATQFLEKIGKRVLSIIYENKFDIKSNFKKSLKNIGYQNTQ